jgi:hypothetical protein
MKLIITFLDSIEPGSQHRRFMGEFELIRKDAPPHFSFHLDRTKLLLPNGADLEVRAFHNVENRAFGLQAWLNGELVFIAASEVERFPCLFEVRFSKEVAIAFTFPVPE